MLVSACTVHLLLNAFVLLLHLNRKLFIKTILFFLIKKFPYVTIMVIVLRTSFDEKKFIS